MNLFIRGEWNPKYNQTVITITQKHGIDTTCVHTADDVFKQMRKDSNLEYEMKFLHQAIPIFKGPVQHTTWIHDIRMNVQKNPKPCLCESEELKHTEMGWHHDFLHEIKTHYKKNQVNAWFRRKMRAKRDKHVVGLIGNLPMLSWINWSNILLSHEDQTKQVLMVSIVTCVIWWMQIVLLITKRLLLPIIRGIG